jgi:DNA-binding NarL/FixJ family response regulator
MNEVIRIGIVEDNPVLLQQLNQNLSSFEEVTVVFTASNGEDALEKMEQCALLPQLVLMDIEMPVLNGIEATRIITTETDVKVLMLTVFDTDEKIFEAVKAGASGYLLKDSKPFRIISAMEDVMQGGAAMSPSIASKALGLLRYNSQQAALPTPDDYNLSAREIELLELLIQAHTYQQIADKMCISHGTVRKHVENIYDKLHIHSKIEAVNKVNAYKWFSKK